MGGLTPTHRISFKFKKTFPFEEFVEWAVGYLAIKHSNLLDYKVSEVAELHYVQLDLEHPALPDPRGTLVTLFDGNKVVREWYQ